MLLPTRKGGQNMLLQCSSQIYTKYGERLRMNSNVLLLYNKSTHCPVYKATLPILLSSGRTASHTKLLRNMKQ